MRIMFRWLVMHKRICPSFTKIMWQGDFSTIADSFK